MASFFVYMLWFLMVRDTACLFACVLSLVCPHVRGEGVVRLICLSLYNCVHCETYGSFVHGWIGIVTMTTLVCLLRWCSLIDLLIVLHILWTLSSFFLAILPNQQWDHTDPGLGPSSSILVNQDWSSFGHCTGGCNTIHHYTHFSQERKTVCSEGRAVSRLPSSAPDLVVQSLAS